ncbi:MAG: thioesterase family protein, partial [Myxococcales bacterium]|nr:thioesterase family protein [Myxococcales bacterium]
MTDDAAFFERDGEDYVASAHGRGPWSVDHLHGGPPTALMARVARDQLGADVAVARVTVELLRPVPIGRLRVVAAPLTTGATAPRVGVTLLSGEQELARAVVMGLREVDAPDAERGGLGERLEPPEAATAFDFAFFRWEVGYHTAMEARLLEGEVGRGPVKMWMRPRVALVAG